MKTLTILIYIYNRAGRLERLVAAMREPACPIPFEMLAVNNNSADNALALLEELALRPGAPLHFMTEASPGIVPARNQAIEEALTSDMLVFIGDDEMPKPGLLSAVHHAITIEGAQDIGGRIEVDFALGRRPPWLSDDLPGFLGETGHGDVLFWITDDSTPMWAGNITYDMRLFRDNPTLRFDHRYNREGHTFGDREDVMLFRRLFNQGVRLRYPSRHARIARRIRSNKVDAVIMLGLRSLNARENDDRTYCFNLHP